MTVHITTNGQVITVCDTKELLLLVDEIEWLLLDSKITTPHLEKFMKIISEATV